MNQFGDEEKAIKIASSKHKTRLDNGVVKPSEMISATTLYQLVGEIREKIVNSKD